ncbi:MAG: NADH-quinone oxidoreductase subunit M [Phycisphaerales bacterium]|nr:NADH-quinone oxidoreductase subunit M [Phycisphaerales bacterium]
MAQSILILLIVVPLAFAAFLAWMPRKHAPAIALMGTSLAALLGVYTALIFDWNLSGRFQLENTVQWLPSLGVALQVGVDGVSLLLVLLTLLLGPICVLCSVTAIRERIKTYYGWLLVLQAAMTGVFVARDLILFYVCFEFTLVPMFILISLYGSTNRRRAAIKFFLYTFTGSIIALAGLVYVAWFAAGRALPGSSGWTFDLDILMRAAAELPPSTQAWVLGALLLGFAVKVPLFPLHTWLPLAHTEAPTAGSVILAGVLLKLGTYGIFRLAIPFAPAAFAEYAPMLAGLSIVGILYGGLICWVQTDVKKLVAYSSVAHLGFCVLGMTAGNEIGLTGSVLYMINHGLSTGALFLLIGMIYERYHTRDMAKLGGLAARMPVWSTFMVFFVMASVGLPGLNGFISEVMCLLGAFQASDNWGSGAWGSVADALPGATPGLLGPWYAAIAGVGMIIAAMYLLQLTGKVVWGPLVEPTGHGHGGRDHGGHGHGGHDSAEHSTAAASHAGGHGAGGADASHTATSDKPHLPTDLTPREIGILVPLAVLCLALGLYPKPVLYAIDGSVAQTANLIREAGALKARPAGSPQVEPAPVEGAPAESDGKASAMAEEAAGSVAAGDAVTGGPGR